MKTLENYALKILADHGCDCYTYGGEYSKHVLDDLKEAYPDGMEFPYVDVANAILNISRTRPIYKAPWQMVYDTDTCTDGIDYESFEAAKESAFDTLLEWMAEERSRWANDTPTEEEIEDYDYMIYNSSTSVYKYNPYTDEYEEYWSPSYEDEKEIGWEPIRKEE